MNRSRTPADKNMTQQKAIKQGGYYDTEGNWNCLVTLDNYPDKVFRGRVEVLVFKEDKIYMQMMSNKYRIPGGSIEKDMFDDDQVYMECKEEAKILIKNIKYTGIDYVEEFDHLSDDKIRWNGKYNKVYVAEFDGYFDGHIDKSVSDPDMAKNGKFYELDTVKDILIPEHKKALEIVFGITESAIEESKRSDLPDEVFGLPKQRKYPMPDKKHVLSAIKFFNYVDSENEKELAKNIKKQMKKYNIPSSSVGKNNRLKQYLSESVVKENIVDNIKMKHGKDPEEKDIVKQVSDYLDSHINGMVKELLDDLNPKTGNVIDKIKNAPDPAEYFKIVDNTLRRRYRVIAKSNIQEKNIKIKMLSVKSYITTYFIDIKRFILKIQCIVTAEKMLPLSVKCVYNKNNTIFEKNEILDLVSTVNGQMNDMTIKFNKVIIAVPSMSRKSIYAKMLKKYPSKKLKIQRKFDNIFIYKKRFVSENGEVHTISDSTIDMDFLNEVCGTKQVYPEAYKTFCIERHNYFYDMSNYQNMMILDSTKLLCIHFKDPKDQKEWDDIVKDTTRLMFGQDGIIYKYKGPNKDEVIISKKTPLDHVIMKITFEHSDYLEISFECLYGTCDEIFPAELLDELVRNCNDGTLFIVRTTLEQDNLNLWFKKLEDAEKFRDNKLYRILDKYKIPYSVEMKQNSNIKVTFRNKDTEILPYYTPDEMKRLGVFGNDNFFGCEPEGKQDRYKLFKQYENTLNVDSYWYAVLQDTYQDMIKNPTNENKQKVLELGWNPNVPLTLKSIMERSRVTFDKLHNQNNIISLEEDAMFSEDDMVYNIDDFLDGKSNILFVVDDSIKFYNDREIAEEFYSVDIYRSYKYTKESDLRIDHPIYDYYEQNPNIKQGYEMDIHSEEYRIGFIKFFNWLVDYVKDKKVVLYGLHLMLINYKDLENYPIIIYNNTNTRSWIRGETGICLDKLVYKESVISVMEACILEAAKQDKYPIFIINVFTNSPFGKLIRAWTRSEYSHSGLAFDTNLTKIFSFNAGYTLKEMRGGISIENLDKYLHDSKDSVMQLNCIFVNKIDFETIKNNVRYLMDRAEETFYDYKNIVNIVFGKVKEMNPDDITMVCSQFVSFVLGKADIKLVDKSFNLTTPNDLSHIESPKVYKLFEGFCRDYKPSAINRIFKKLKLKASLIKENKQ